ncbi:efflux RND transporter periplasmic adaptor subunit [Neorhodopirellula pilleata]|uniref:efflux RND transporter periplasmic adaptor subunit n=1 Tax=Neorhodopirellula pilleata TaxID=2714738 RepID=UPI0018CFB563|nr:HlyD family efflux transporter periplasmic adaptor subunit [Neorhodopirellula pilleata]
MSRPHTDVSVTPAGTLSAPQLFQSFRGEIRPRRESSLAIRRAGILAEIMVHEGDRVRLGDVLARLDTSDLDVREQLADAEVDAAEAAVTEAVRGPRYQTLRASAARVRQLKAQLSAAQSRWERQQKLDVRNSGTAQELDDARFASEELQARLEAAVAELDELNEGTRVEQIDAAKAQRRVAIAARQQVDVDRRDSQILAPYDGVIANRYFDEGAMLSPGQPVLRILETDPIEARFGVPAGVADTMSIGDSLTVVIGENQATARIVRMQPQVDEITRTRAIDVQLDPSTNQSPAIGGVLVGQTASLQIPATNSTTAHFSDTEGAGNIPFWLPTESLVKSSRGLWSIYVAVRQSDRGIDLAEIERREVRIVRTTGQLTLVQGMLRSGELVVTDGAHRIGPGVAVRVHVDPVDRIVEQPLASQHVCAPESLQ